jgi:hypothetical protein
MEELSNHEETYKAFANLMESDESHSRKLVKAMSESLGVTVGELRRMAAAGELETGPMLDRLEGQMSRVRE